MRKEGREEEKEGEKKEIKNENKRRKDIGYKGEREGENKFIFTYFLSSHPADTFSETNSVPL